MIRKILFLMLFAFLYACSDNDTSVFESTSDNDAIHLGFNQTLMENYSPNLKRKKSASVAQFVSDVNASLSSQGLSLQLNAVEYYGSDGMGNTFFFNNTGNKQLSGDFVPGDPRRFGINDIIYARDGAEGATSSGLSQAETDAAILSAMDTWDNVNCSGGLVLTDIGAFPDIGVVEAIVTGGASGSFNFVDLMHSGFNTTVTDAVFGPGSNVLGVAFTFVWIDGGGNPTDIDNNGKDDVAFRDIYYNDDFNWNIGANIDVETVALHEAGHGLSQAHFGKLFQKNNGNFQFSPRAVMNAGYTGVQTSIGQTDQAGHCSNWAQWPNN